MLMNPHIRFARLGDCPQMIELYRPYIEESAISFETETPTIQEFSDRFQRITERYPWLVFEKSGEILGYAYGASHRARAAYDWSCEVTVYVRKNHHRQGIGQALYKMLFPLLEAQDFCNLYAGVTQPNLGSDRIHKSLGFQELGTFKNVGYKFSQWYDVSWYQMELKRPQKPTTPVSIDDLFQNIRVEAIDPRHAFVSRSVDALDEYLSKLYPAEENHLDSPTVYEGPNNQLVAAYAKDLHLGIGGVKLRDDYGEIKRMWIHPLFRGRGVSSQILHRLEAITREAGLNLCRLETGVHQKEALRLYEKAGYSRTSSFGNYKTTPFSVFFEKRLL
ncbi:MAG: GNAT family N-acetyltransferase [Pseudomonadota bacterium]